MLVTRRSNLKDLKFDKDTRGGGSSGQPYIKGGLPENSPAGEALADIVRFSKDFPLRGGASSLIFSTQDTIRVSRFLNDFPEGALFTAKQIGLQSSNPLMETGDRGTRFSLDGSSANINTQRYNLNANLLAQVALQGTGFHLPRAGFNTNDLRDPQNKYEYIVKERNEEGLNRLEALYTTKIQGASLDPTISSFIKERTGISDPPPNGPDKMLFNYPGGPGSVYGSGTTLIPRVTDTTISYQDYISNPKGWAGKPNYNPVFKTSERPLPGDTNYQNSLGLSDYIKDKNITGLKDILTKETDFTSISLFGVPITFPKNLYQQSSPKQSPPDFIRPTTEHVRGDEVISPFSNTLKYTELLSSKETSGGEFKLRDFRQFTDAKKLAKSVDYSEFNIESRIGVGSPGSRTREKRDNFYTPFVDRQDKINMSPIYRKDFDVPVERDGDDVRDLIKFVIEVLDNTDSNLTERMHFRAYITNFSDNIGADWNDSRYMGRGENFYTYQGFTREVGFTFIVAAQSVQEMEKLYQKVNYLASTLHPDYNNNGFMRGNLHRLTIGEYFYRTPGIITSMNITVEDNYPWEIKMKQPELSGSLGTTGNPANDDRGQMEVPQMLKIQMNFKPIRDQLPKRGLKEPIIISEKIANNYLARQNFNFNNNNNSISQPQISLNITEDTQISTETNTIITTSDTLQSTADSWQPGRIVATDSINGPLGTSIWKVVQDSTQGLYEGFYTLISSGLEESSGASNFIQITINSAKEDAFLEVGL